MDGRVLLGDLGGRVFFWVRSDRSIDRSSSARFEKQKSFFKKTKQKRVDWFYLDDTGFFFIHVKVACGLCHDPSFLPLEFCVVVKETKGSPSCQQIACLLASRSLKLTGEGFFFLFVMGQNSFDGFGNIVPPVLVLIKMVSSLRLDPLVKQIGFLFGTMVGGFRVTTAG